MKVSSLFLSLASLFGAALFSAAAEEWTPVSVWTDDKCHSADYAPEKMIDGDPETYACFLDSTRDGLRPDTAPGNAELPITCRFTLDLGETRTTAGMRLTARNFRGCLNVKNVTVLAADDPRGETGLRPLAQNVALPPMNYGNSSFVTWPPAEARYLAVEVNDAYTIRHYRVLKRYVGTHYNVQIAEIGIFSELPEENTLPNPPDTAFPQERLFGDWLDQDLGAEKADLFTSSDGSLKEAALIEKVLEEIDGYGPDEGALAKITEEKQSLLAENIPGSDPRWKELYKSACSLRRVLRLAPLTDSTRQVIYVKHHVLGSTEGLTGHAHLSDEQYYDQTPEMRPGSQLCRLTVQPDGSVTNEVLVDQPDGVIRDPALSFDGKTLVFSMRSCFETDDYHLWQMSLDTGELKQLTDNLTVDGVKYTCADVEPCFSPDGGIIFTSTRHTQINDCWPVANLNLYRCDADGKNIQRLSFDELDANYPQALDDGRILFTRWEYNDRNAFFLHPLMTMNPDGTMQTEYCGNNSMFPSSYIQARGVPGCSKVIAIISGHHTYNKGKLALVDRALGTQNGEGIEFVAGASPDGTPGRARSTIKTEGFLDWNIDFFGQDGPQWQYPFALDEENYLTSYSPTGWPREPDWPYFFGPFWPPFGLYFMTAEGQRELLAFDPAISSCQAVPVMGRPVPPNKPSGASPRKNFGTFIVQDIYLGPGLEGIERGTVKRLRVVALEYRAAKMGKGSNGGEVASGLNQTPISFNNGSWDVKHVLGEVDIEEDGSVFFEVPARTPVYFQLLDEKGYMVQTMRSWATLQGGEQFACLGCHEDKNQTGAMEQNHAAPIALSKPAQKLRPIGRKRHRLLERLEKENALDSAENYFGVNMPAMTADADAPCDGFSYRQEIQPILDRHCVVCHAGKQDDPDPNHRSSLVLTGDYQPVETQRVSPDDDPKRRYSRSYLALTNNGHSVDNPLMQWIEPRSRSEMLPPYHTGSSKSPIMAYFQPEHYGVQVSDEEKRTFACWIDLAVPFCGTYTDANRWTPAEKEEYLFYLAKRRAFADSERAELKKRDTSK
ncbi:MAG: hypothetical protein IIZ25_05150 [Thermoguttaceae bacterium]|nr:hypothetical protein [Thermoguttaceae bacterium]